MVLSDIESSGGGSSNGEPVFSFERPFEKVRVEHDVGAGLDLLNRSLKDEIPSDYSSP